MYTSASDYWSACSKPREFVAMYTSASGLLKCLFQAKRVSGNNIMYKSASGLLKNLFQAKRVNGNVYVC